MSEQFFTAKELEDLECWLEEDEANLELLNRWVTEVTRIISILAAGLGGVNLKFRNSNPRGARWASKVLHYWRPNTIS